MEKVKATSILLSAGISSRMKSYEPRSLLKVRGSTLSEIQSSNLKSKYDGDIILVAGFKFQKVYKKLSKAGIVVLENQQYLETGASESLRIALTHNQNDSVCVVHGDILFNLECLDVPHDESFVLMDRHKDILDREVGVTVWDGLVTTLSYGLPNKWAQIVYFTGKEFEIVKELYNSKMIKNNRLLFEIINKVIDLGGKFRAYTPENIKLIEIDTIGDIKYENTNS